MLSLEALKGFDSDCGGVEIVCGCVSVSFFSMEIDSTEAGDPLAAGGGGPGTLPDTLVIIPSLVFQRAIQF
jgi:hypothetical protein